MASAHGGIGCARHGPGTHATGAGRLEHPGDLVGGRAGGDDVVDHGDMLARKREAAAERLAQGRTPLARRRTLAISTDWLKPRPRIRAEVIGGATRRSGRACILTRAARRVASQRPAARSPAYLKRPTSRSSGKRYA